MRGAALLLALVGFPAAGQIAPDHFKPAPPGVVLPPEPAAPVERPPVTSVPADVAVLRGLDKMTGAITTFELRVGEVRDWERLSVTLGACRLPGPGAPPDAFAWLEIRDRRRAEPDFRGWMVASSPALSTLDHPRYDLWVLSCRTSSGEASTESARK